MSDIQVKELLEAGVHFGHQTTRWNPKMRNYIFSSRNGIHMPLLQATVAVNELLGEPCSGALDDSHVIDLAEGRASLDAFRGLVFVGGFSYADVLDSAKGWAGAIRFPRIQGSDLETLRHQREDVGRKFSVRRQGGRKKTSEGVGRNLPPGPEENFHRIIQRIIQ